MLDSNVERGQLIREQKYRQFEEFLLSNGFDKTKLEMHVVPDPDGHYQWISNRYESWPTGSGERVHC